jgi:hypothetical protein
MQRVLMFSNDNIDMFSSPENLCAYIEYPSFDGDEEVCLESGQAIRLFLDRGVITKGLLGREKYVDDFIFVNFEVTNDFSSKGRFRSKLRDYLANNKVDSDDNATLSELFDLTQNLIGIVF